MFKRILIANRGEIAVRVIRACRELGIETVAVYSLADKDSLHVRMADYAVCIGPPQPAYSYLSVVNLISAAKNFKCDAIHPGYGFLAENAGFAKACEDNDIVFIGPKPQAIQLAGDKARAKELMRDHRIPVIPGSVGAISSEKEALKVAKKMGYPVILKASAGGGGRGMRVARSEKELSSLLYLAKREARSAFGSEEIYIEKLIERPRHVEFQIVADACGNVIHLGERDCSVQRRHQKLLEESPSTALTERRRREMGEVAVKVARVAAYTNVGTVEFLIDGSGEFYFMEMNARIQVEHPVTEMVTGLDLVKLQIAIACGDKLQVEQEDVRLSGWAIEMRINAEDPWDDFRPQSGTVGLAGIPGGPGIRVDTHVYDGYTIPVFYDSMLMKLIAWGASREEAIARARRALEELEIEGVPTTKDFHMAILDDPRFRQGNLDTNYVEELIGRLCARTREV